MNDVVLIIGSSREMVLRWLACDERGVALVLQRGFRSDFAVFNRDRAVFGAIYSNEQQLS